jgi:glucuronyl/N-acetylglucosaminyl transferase EXT2
MVAGAGPDFNTVVDLSLGRALVAGAGFSSWTYRPGFDVSLPMASPVALRATADASAVARPWLVVSSQINLRGDHMQDLQHLAQHHKELLLLEACASKNYSIRCNGDTVYQFPEVCQYK